MSNDDSPEKRRAIEARNTRLERDVDPENALTNVHAAMVAAAGHFSEIPMHASHLVIDEVIKYFTGQGIPSEALLVLAAIRDEMVDISRGGHGVIFQRKARTGALGQPPKPHTKWIGQQYVGAIIQCCQRDLGNAPRAAAHRLASKMTGLTVKQLEYVDGLIRESKESSKGIYDELMRQADELAQPLVSARYYAASFATKFAS